MSLVVSLLYQKAVDTASPEWREECEASWLLAHKPTRAAKHRYLYGVSDRQQIMATDREFGKEILASDWKTISDGKSVLSSRGLEAADKLLADAKLLYERRKAQTPEGDDDDN